MTRDRAAYMREYRAKQRAKYPPPGPVEGAALRKALVAEQNRTAELEEEVRHLKAELAKRPAHSHNPEIVTEVRWDERPVRPVPKHR